MPEGNPFTAEKERRKNPFTAEKARRTVDGSGAEAFGLSQSRQFLNNALAFPSAAGKGLQFASAGVATGMNKLLGRDLSFQETLDIARRESVLDDIPAPTIEDIGAGVRSLPALMPGGQSFGERFQQKRGAMQADIGQMQAEHPFASGAGEVGGDVATIMTGRLPFAKAINRAESRLVPRAEMMFGSAAPKVIDPGAKRFVQRVIDSPTLRRVARGAGRSLETGFEASVLDLLHGDDPLETAAFAAGGQLGGSLLLTGMKGIFSGGALKTSAKLGLTALSVGSFLQVLKSATPGGKNFFLDSIETGYDKVTFGLVLGAMSAAVGSGRLRGGQFAEDFPKLSDALATSLRAGTISLIEDWANADPETQKTTETVLTKLVEDPTFFGEDLTKRLQTAVEGGTFIEQIKELQEEREFQQKLFSIQPPKLSAGGF